MNSNVVGLIVLDHVIRVVPTRMSQITFELYGARELSSDHSSNAARL